MSPQTQSKAKYILVIFAWIVLYFIYVILGGYIISTIEHDHDIDQKIIRKDKFMSTLEKYNYSMNDTPILEIIESAIDAYSYDAFNVNEVNQNVTSQWNLGTGIFFCNTIVTTIGYGNIYPRTDTGRTFTIFYALFGIAITGIVLIKIGGALGNCIEKSDAFWERIIRKFITDRKKSKVIIRVTQLVITLLSTVAVVWILPAFVLSSVEGWNFLTSTYFCFITLTTIGLGDVVPGRNHEEGGKPTPKEVLYQYVSILYILVGLASLSTLLSMAGAFIKSISDRVVSQAEDLLMQTTKMVLDINSINIDNMLKETKGRIPMNTANVNTNTIPETRDKMLQEIASPFRLSRSAKAESGSEEYECEGYVTKDEIDENFDNDQLTQDVTVIEKTVDNNETTKVQQHQVDSNSSNTVNGEHSKGSATNIVAK